MQKLNLPRYEWAEFFLNLGAIYRNQPVSINHRAGENSSSLKLNKIILRDIVLSEDSGSNIIIHASDDSDQEVNHVINQPRKVEFETQAGNGISEVSITNIDDVTTTFKFR
jgi:hypothetical protein